MADTNAPRTSRSRHSLRYLLADLMNVEEPELEEQTNLETFASWDSQREVELRFMLHFEYGVDVSEEELARLRTVGEIRSLLTAQGISDV